MADTAGAQINSSFLLPVLHNYPPVYLLVMQNMLIYYKELGVGLLLIIHNRLPARNNSKELIFFSPGHIQEYIINEFYLAALTFKIFFYKVDVDQE